jgi:hypothetical protein
MPRYFAHISGAGPVRYGQLPGSIGVLDAPDHPMPIGTAFASGRTEAGLAVWRLTVDDDDVPRRWVIVDREFRPVRDEGAGGFRPGVPARACAARACPARARGLLERLHPEEAADDDPDQSW